MAFQHLRSTLHVFRPRVLARTTKSVDDLRAEVSSLRDEIRDLKRSLKYLKEQDAALTVRHEKALAFIEAQLQSITELHHQQHQKLTEELRGAGRTLSELRLRESQLRAIARRDAELESEQRALDPILHEPTIRAHVERSVAAATLREQPLPFAVVDDILPACLYTAVLTGLPPIELFADRPVNKQQLNIPLDFGPAYSRRVWGYIAHTVARSIIAPIVVERFRVPLTCWLRDNFPSLGDDPLRSLELTTSQGRIMLRRRGYRILPHRDPKWGFLTCLMYLARPGDDGRWGTQLFAVETDCEARGAHPHWIDPDRCRLIEEVEFRPNRALVFLNSIGAHGAHIPDDAEPASLERYTYQFRIGATGTAISGLVASLPEERRALWAGKVAEDY